MFTYERTLALPRIIAVPILFLGIMYVLGGVYVLVDISETDYELLLIGSGIILISAFIFFILKPAPLKRVIKKDGVELEIGLSAFRVFIPYASITKIYPVCFFKIMIYYTDKNGTDREITVPLDDREAFAAELTKRTGIPATFTETDADGNIIFSSELDNVMKWVRRFFFAMMCSFMGIGIAVSYAQAGLSDMVFVCAFLGSTFLIAWLAFATRGRPALYTFKKNGFEADISVVRGTRVFIPYANITDFYSGGRGVVICFEGGDEKFRGRVCLLPENSSKLIDELVERTGFKNGPFDGVFKKR